MRLLELEAENGELKNIIEQMTNDVKRIKSAANNGDDVVVQEKTDEDHTKTIYELRRELFRLQQESRRLTVENEMLRTDERASRLE